MHSFERYAPFYVQIPFTAAKLYVFTETSKYSGRKITAEGKIKAVNP
jgi:hypothetical protein